MNLSDIHAGDEIEYECIVGRNSIQKSTGRVVSVSEKFISIQGKKYPDSILINDLKCGRAAIVSIKHNKEVEQMPLKIATPSPEVLKKTFETSQNINEFAEKLGAKPTTARTWLINAGLPTRFTYKPVVKTEPKQETSCAEPVKATPVAIKDNPNPVVVPKYLEPIIASLPPDELEEILAEEFTAEDDEPIPYKLAEPVLDLTGSVEDICKVLADEAEPTLDQMKCIWIEDIMDTFMKAATRLDYIAAIMGLEVGRR